MKMWLKINAFKQRVTLEMSCDATDTIISKFKYLTLLSARQHVCYTAAFLLELERKSWLDGKVY